MQAANQSSENAAFPAAQKHPDRWIEHCDQDFFQLGRLAVPIQKRKPLLVQRADAAEQNSLKQSFFGSEMVMNGRKVDVGVGDDAAQRSPGKTLFGK
jgi:hypothetical protein